MNRPTKKRNDYYPNELDTQVCYREGYNDAIAKFDAFLPTESELVDIIDFTMMAITEKIDKGETKPESINFSKFIAGAIFDRLQGE